MKIRTFKQFMAAVSKDRWGIADERGSIRNPESQCPISSIIQDPAVEFCVMLLFILGTGCGLFLAFYDEYDDL
jgi:hypothetical protein